MGHFAQRAFLLMVPSLGIGLWPILVEAATFSLEDASIADVQAAFKADALTSVELTQLYLNRIATYDQAGPNINAVPVINPKALDQAARLDKLWQQGKKVGPLHGIPVIIKDSYDVKDLQTTNGVEELKTFTANDDSFAAERLKKAGAIVLGKANMSTWAFSYDGISEAYGPVINPYAPDRTPGGSSSGTGAGVAASFAMLGMGGETGGSIRVPSTHNALVGLKPSAGLISVDGTWPLVTERDVVGPMAKSVADVATAMDALVAPDPANIWNPYIPDIEAVKPDSYQNFLSDTSLEGKVLGLPRPYIGKGDPAKGESFPLDPQVAAAFETAKQTLKAQGATLREVDIPAHETWFIDFLVNENPPFGYPTDSDRSLQSRAYYYEQLVKGYDDDKIKSFVDLLDIYSEDYRYYGYVKAIADTIAAGEDKPWEELPDVEQALDAIDALRTLQYEDFMESSGIDAFVFPTLNYLAPPQGEGASEVYATYGSLPARFEANILGVPGITVPMGYSEEGIPMSLEFMGNYFGESEIIGYAYDYEQATMFRRSPDLVPPLMGETFDYEPVPEPGMIPGVALVGLGLLGYGWQRRGSTRAKRRQDKRSRNYVYAIACSKSKTWDGDTKASSRTVGQAAR
ncbi:amidase [Romeria aff. gracilis LEGE 07310]|uniref:Amidase n=1 Tax=Vasconcelosia minhoensis LEGE 07310 TaxID=915328 RepID=A0A8J7ACN1_9CYAN|nr:amidase [Romeria gracilis]MBE9077264.1 amidase [Romeria aff. gracilis LEGE 07310]